MGHIANHSLLPGTNTKRQHKAASMSATSARTVSDRLARRRRTYGSRIRKKEKRVYSEPPARAKRGSSMYWWVARV